MMQPHWLAPKIHGVAPLFENFRRSPSTGRRARSFPSFCVSKGLALLCTIALAVAVAAAGAVAAPGLDQAPVVGPYFDGVFPLSNPGNGSSTTWRVVNAYPHLTFNDPLVYTPVPGTDRVVVASRDGYIEWFVNDPQTMQKNFLLDLRDVTAVVWDGGFLGLSFHPEFGQGTGHDWMFVYYSARNPGDPIPTSSTNGFFNSYLRLARYDVDPITMVVDEQSELRMFNVRLYNGSHRGGGLTFGLDGMLYLSIGDQFRYYTAQELTTNFEGGVIRVDVDQDSTRSHAPLRRMPDDTGETDEYTGIGYLVPDDNPFLDPTGTTFEEFWTLGNRAPHRMTVDPVTGRFWSGEVGEYTREEINVIESGGNYGWPFFEGTVAGPEAPPDSMIGTLKMPVIDFTRSDAYAIIGGYVYRGTRLPSLYGRYLCGDYGTGKIWALDYDDSTGTATKEYLCQFTPGMLVTWGQDLDGEVYLCGLGQNRPIFQLEEIVVDAPAPALLSQVGFFTDLDSLTVTPEAIPFSVNVPFWSDGALKSRWALIPNDGTPQTTEELIAYSPTAPWKFPEGTVLVKHMEMPLDRSDPSVRRRLETRFLVNGIGGVTYGLTYRWRPDGSDADLLVGAVDDTLSIATPAGPVQQVWHYPSRSECLNCHEPNVGYSLGMNARQLNRDSYYPATERVSNQLVTLSSVGLLDTPIDSTATDSIPRLVALDDETASVEVRARSFLDANCSHCHQPDTGNRAIFDARFVTPLEAQNLVRGAVIEDLGIAGAQVIAPQDVSRSLLHLRASSRQPGVGMPPLATSILDTAGVDLLRQWIEVLDADLPMNVALGKAADASSEWYGAAASRAVDGNEDGDMAKGSVFETAYEYRPWWEVDLGDTLQIDRVVLFNRTDCCSDRLKDFHVFVSVDSFLTDDPDSIAVQPGVTALFYAGQAPTRTEFALGIPGRFVRVQLDGYNHMELAEVQVFSQNWSAPPIEKPVLGNAFATDAVHDSTVSNLVVNLSDTYVNDEVQNVRLRVDDFSFYAWQAADPVTPFVARKGVNGFLTVLAVGTTRTSAEYAVGPNTFAFAEVLPPIIGLAPGDTLVTGFIDALSDGTGGGMGSVIPYTESGATDTVWWTGSASADTTGTALFGHAVTEADSLHLELSRDYHYAISMTRMQAATGTVTGVDDPPSARPSTVRVALPAPNPFNPRTVLRLELERPTRVNWAIFDLRGRRVRTLADGLLEAGAHVEVWDGTDARGRRVSSGVYFQRVQTPQRTVGNKMLLLK